MATEIPGELAPQRTARTAPGPSSAGGASSRPTARRERPQIDIRPRPLHGGIRRPTHLGRAPPTSPTWSAAVGAHTCRPEAQEDVIRRNVADLRHGPFELTIITCRRLGYRRHIHTAETGPSQ